MAVGCRIALCVALALASMRPAWGQTPEQERCIALQKRAEALKVQGKIAEAIAAYEEIVVMAPRVFGAEAASTGNVMINLAELFTSRGNDAKAIPLYEKALKIRETRWGRESEEAAVVMNNLGNAHRRLGQFDRAKELYLSALKSKEVIFFPEHPEVAVVLNNLGLLHMDRGRLDQAIPYFERTLANWEKKQRSNHADLATALDNLATAYLQLGQLERAEAMALRCLKSRETSTSSKMGDRGLTCNNLAAILHASGRHTEALAYSRKAIELLKNEFGPDHPKLAMVLSNFGSLLHEAGKRTESEQVLKQSVRLLDSSKAGLLHLAHAQGNLADLYFDMGRRDEARPLYRRCLEIREAKLGRDHADTAAALQNMASLCAAEKDWAQAVGHVYQARRVLARHFSQVLPSLSEQEQVAFMDRDAGYRFHFALSLGFARRQDPSAVEASAAWLINGKALVHETLADRHLLTREARDATVAILAKDLNEIRKTLAALLNRSPQEGQENRYRDEIKELFKREQDLAGRLARTVHRPHRADPWVELGEVRKKLPKTAVFVDIARFSVRDFEARKWLAARYVAWITPPDGQGAVRIIDLGEAEPIEAAVQRARESIVKSAALIGKQGEPEAIKETTQPLRDLAHRVLHPLLNEIGRYQDWIICPDGALWLVPWACLPLADGRFTVEKHLIRHVISGRDLVTVNPKVKVGTPYIFADPDFDMAPAEATKIALQLTTGVSAPAGSEIKKPTGTDVRRAIGAARLIPKVPRLPNSALEASSVAALIKSEKPVVHTDGAASEGVLKLVQSPRILLLSTHGYFMPDQALERREPNNSVPYGTAIKDKKRLENPFLRCGLLLAGCNRRDQAGPGDDDGILTGLEVLGMDLRGCELVALSACDTGVGQIRNGEGVAGLRQAFMLAGADAVLASLWQVSDRETALLMSAFFLSLAKGQSRAEALRNAQLHRIEARRQQFGAAHPFYWAAFGVTDK